MQELQAHETRNARDGSRVEWLETQLKDRDELINVLKGKLDGNISHNLSMEHALDDARVAVGCTCSAPSGRFKSARV